MAGEENKERGEEDEKNAIWLTWCVVEGTEDALWHRQKLVSERRERAA